MGIIETVMEMSEIKFESRFFDRHRISPGASPAVGCATALIMAPNWMSLK